MDISAIQVVEAGDVLNACICLSEAYDVEHYEEFVIRSFRHFMRDRLRAEEYPSEIIDATSDWLSACAGNSNGGGYPFEVKQKWMSKLILCINQS